MDLLVSGSEREPRRLPPRLRRSGAAALVVAAAGAAGVSVQQHLAAGAEQRVHDAASAEDDEVQLRARLQSLSGAEPGTGRLVADVGVTGQRRGRLTSVRLVGPGLTSAPGAAPVLAQLPGSVPTEATVDCRVVPERLPERAEVVVTVAQASGAVHEQRLPAPRAVLREAVLRACDEPDPTAEPRVEVSGQDSRLVLYVETVPRSDADLRIEQVSVPGFAVAGVALPYALMPDSGGLLGFSLSIVDCSLALRADSSVTVRLSADGVASDRVAAPARTSPHPGPVPVAELLADLVADDC